MNPMVAHRGLDARDPAHRAVGQRQQVALLRNSRHLGIPERGARCRALRSKAGAHGITVHPRPDERHIRTHDVHDLAALLQQWPQAEFNIEGNPFAQPA